MADGRFVLGPSASESVVRSCVGAWIWRALIHEIPTSITRVERVDPETKATRKIFDTIADNASSAGFVLGPQRVSPKDVDICAIDAVLTRNGEVVAEGRSDAVLGNPVTAVAWLARKVDSFGVRLKAGDILPDLDLQGVDGTPRKLLDVSRLTNMGWTAGVPLEEGIRQTYDWYLANEGSLRTA